VSVKFGQDQYACVHVSRTASNQSE